MPRIYLAGEEEPQEINVSNDTRHFKPSQDLRQKTGKQGVIRSTPYSVVSPNHERIQLRTGILHQHSCIFSPGDLARMHQKPTTPKEVDLMSGPKPTPLPSCIKLILVASLVDQRVHKVSHRDAGRDVQSHDLGCFGSEDGGGL